MTTQFYDKVKEYKTLEYTKSNIKYQQYEPKETINYYKVFFDFETITGDFDIDDKKLTYHI